MAQLGITRVELPLKHVLDLIKNPVVFGTSRSIRGYISRLSDNLSLNTSGKVDAVGFSIALYRALADKPRHEKEEAQAIFPKILERIAKSGEPGAKFASEAAKFTLQFSKKIRGMR